MRADRLVAALLLLQARGRVTAAQLADELEVSVATARRDLEALSGAGIPVYPQPGRGGGWSLIGGARTDLSGLSAPEAQRLFLLLGPAAAGSGEAKAALRKLVQALPQTFRADAEAAATATMVDPTRWGERDRPRPEMVDRLQAAVVRRRKVRLTYTSRARERSERLVDPWGLVDKDDIWYLVAGTERGRRTFRVDRIVAAEPTDEPAERPDDFALAAAWREVVDDMERQRSRTWATVLIDARFVPILRGHFGRHCHTDGRLDDGRARVRIAAPTPLDIARNLAGWGARVEVLEPASVQAELARIGTELAGLYPSPAAPLADQRTGLATPAARNASPMADPSPDGTPERPPDRTLDLGPDLGSGKPEPDAKAFDAFEELDVPVGETTIHGRRGGAGPPVLLLHGIPETHLMWHRVAPRLAEHLTVVATDLRGFGTSGTPPSTPDHGPYSMRALARDQVEVMRALGFDRFAVVGHDRGARCAYRMALDHPQVVTRLAVLDIVPTAEAFRRADKDFSLGFWVWSFLAAPAPVPEQMIAGAPEAFVDHMLDTWSSGPGTFPPEVRAAYVAQFRQPARVHAICEEYRAAATLDVEHDEADRGRRRITCPTLALWSGKGPVGTWYDALDLWRAWADDVRGGPLPGGHFLPEEAPDETTRALLDFLLEANPASGATSPPSPLFSAPPQP